MSEKLFKHLWQEHRLLLLESEKREINDLLTDQWVSVEDRLPEHNVLVWISDGNGITGLGCLNQELGLWAESNITPYQFGDDITAECYIEDVEVKFWHPVPKPKKA